MPWPTNSRTTENPCDSTCRCTACADIRHPAARPDLLDRLVQRLVRHPQQRRRLLRHRTDRQRDRAVAEIPVERRADVDRDDVAALQQPAPRGDAVDHLVVDRRANRRRIPVIPLERRRRARLPDPLLGQRIEIARAHADRHVRRQAPSALRRPGDRPRACDRAPISIGRQSPRTRLRRRHRHLCAASTAAARSAATLSGGCAPLTDRNVGRRR